jgi:Protein of unknown function (DUF4446)
VDSLSSTVGIVALAACAVAVVALVFCIVLAVRLRRLRATQRVLLADGERDLVAHSAELTDGFQALHDYVEDVAQRLIERLTTAEQRLDGAVAYRGLVRFDAYNELSGRQSTSIALLDASKSGLVLSSIAHRDQARIYAKQVVDGRGDVQLAPEEEEAVRRALAGEGPPSPPDASG